MFEDGGTHRYHWQSMWLTIHSRVVIRLVMFSRPRTALWVTFVHWLQQLQLAERDLFVKLYLAFSFHECIHSSVRILNIVSSTDSTKVVGVEALVVFWTWGGGIADDLPTQCAHGFWPSHFVRSWLH
jgi:hypothetical protein